jgi:hypothetical protein
MSPIRAACQVNAYPFSMNIYLVFEKKGENTEYFKALCRGKETTKPWGSSRDSHSQPQLTPGPTKGCS